MPNIVGAIQKEKEYLAYRMQGKLPYNWADVVKQFGFESMDEFQRAKRQYYLCHQNFTVINQPMPEGVTEIFKTIARGTAGLLLVDWEDTYVVCGDRGLQEYNKTYCEEHNITVFPLNALGGTIVGSKGDFSFGICVPLEVDATTESVLLAVAEILQKYTDKVLGVDHNDITVDGKKICGSTTYTNDAVFMVIMHFSFSDLSQLISDICTTTKTGKLVTYVDFITREQFREEILGWLNPQY